MIDRRSLLASVAGLIGFAAFQWLRISPAGAAGKFEIEKTEAEWRAQLTPQQYEILRREGTEPPGSSPLLEEHRKGIFACAGCDLPLFSSETKFESGTGWPSFYKPLENAVGKTEDRTFGVSPGCAVGHLTFAGFPAIVARPANVPRSTDRGILI
jgi:peptide-methionine (R)-S-oxide reductase